ncbi:amino acid dehydrogenase family protein [Sesbania bispinosa]|nr:amino acid dehydrogenase family protein [Sesbania bispinosa]
MRNKVAELTICEGRARFVGMEVVRGGAYCSAVASAISWFRLRWSKDSDSQVDHAHPKITSLKTRSNQRTVCWYGVWWSRSVRMCHRWEEENGGEKGRKEP